MRSEGTSYIRQVLLSFRMRHAYAQQKIVDEKKQLKKQCQVRKEGSRIESNDLTKHLSSLIAETNVTDNILCSEKDLRGENLVTCYLNSTGVLYHCTGVSLYIPRNR